MSTQVLDEPKSATATLLKTYSVVIRWSDHYADMGDYGECVRARSGPHAVRIVRARMARQQWSEREEGETKAESLELYRNSSGRLFGSVLECHEGAIWKAKELEAALRECIAWIRAELDGRLPVEPLANAEKIIAEIDAMV